VRTEKIENGWLVTVDETKSERGRAWIAELVGLDCGSFRRKYLTYEYDPDCCQRTYELRVGGKYEIHEGDQEDYYCAEEDKLQRLDYRHMLNEMEKAFSDRPIIDLLEDAHGHRLDGTPVFRGINDYIAGINDRRYTTVECDLQLESGSNNGGDR